jgi:site-specific DNA recombinase
MQSDMKRTVRSVTHTSSKESVVGYIRVSSKGQTQEAGGYGADLQERSIKDYCRSVGRLEIHDIFVDNAISGTEKGMESREAFFEMLKFCESNGPTKVIVYDLSRLWRDELTSAMIKRELKKRQATIVSIQQPQYSLDSESPSEFLVSSILSSIATFDWMNLLVRMNGGRESKLLKGGFGGGGIPLGFVVKDKELVVQEEEMNVVRYIYKKRRAGWSAYKIAKELRDNLVIGKNGGKFMPATVAKVLRSKIYKGYLRYSGKLYPSSLGKLI